MKKLKCPKCNGDMKDYGKSQSYATVTPIQGIKCESCGYKTMRTAK